MTDGTPASLALQTALAYFRAWTSHDIDWAMTYIADDIICQAPGQRLEGAAAFRGFMGPLCRFSPARS
jgi:ketosteroid isomerase-like protein